MKRILKGKWVIAAFWIAAVIILKLSMPDMDKLVLEKGQPKIPDNYPIAIAKSLTKELSNENKSSRYFNLLVVFHDENGLSEEELKEIKNGVAKLKDSSNSLGITKLLTHFENENLEEQLLSKDGTTVMVVLNVEEKGREISEINDEIQNELSSVSSSHYITGSELINDGYVKTLHAASRKTETFTYLIISIILLIVFRSALAPLVSLFTIAITYISSLGIVLLLVDKFNFPFSTITQTFLTLVLFGIGTDYTILLLMRYKEELKHCNVEVAVINTYKSAGKTVLYSAFTVLIGFAVLAFAKFSVFKSTTAVAIAVCILLLELFTLLPILMKLLGGRLFWPSRADAGHRKSKLWEKASSLSIKNPLFPIVLGLIITVPPILLYSNRASYDLFSEVDSSYDCIKAVNIVSKAFGKGNSFPVTIILKNDAAMNRSKTLSDIDRITEELDKINGVDKVYSITRPKGAMIKELYVENQTKAVYDGLSSAKGGINSVSDGLSEVSGKLSAPQDFSQVDSLIYGTKAVNNGLSQVTDAMKKVESGVKNGALGAEELSKGLGELKLGMDKLSISTDGLYTSYNNLQKGLGDLGSKYAIMEQQIGLIETNLNNINGFASKLVQNHPEIQSDSTYIALVQTVSGLSTQVHKLRQSFVELNGSYNKALESFGKANEGLNNINAGEKQLSAGLEKLKSGADSLAGGLNTADSGQNQIISSTSTLQQGVNDIGSGELQLKEGLEKFSSSMPQLKDALSRSTEGLKTIVEGMDKANSYIFELSNSSERKTLYIPDSVLNSEDFKASLNSYMSQDYTLTKFIVNLSVDPYSKEAIEIVNKINDTLQQETKGSSLSNCSIGIDGASSTNADLDRVSTGDLSRSKLIMLIGIAVVLLMVTRSLYLPVCILASLIISYYTSISVTQFVFEKLLHRGSLSWSVPFFSFIMLIALGVDYSIFLITRYNEYMGEGLDTRTAIVKASANIGGVIMAAAVILSGTFAALYPANLTTQVQLATAVIMGLLLLSAVFLPIFIPALISIREKLDERSKEAASNKVSNKRFI